MNNNIIKKNILLIGVIAILFSVSYTLARTFWVSDENTTFDTTIGDVANVRFNNGDTINVTDLAPVFDYHDSTNIEFSTYNKTRSAVNLTVKLNITSIDTALKSTDFKYVLEKYNNSTSKYESIANGNFSSFNTGNNTIMSSISTARGYSYFKFYVYIDGNSDNNSNLMNKTLVSNLYVTDGDTSTD